MAIASQLFSLASFPLEPKLPLATPGSLRRQYRLLSGISRFGQGQLLTRPIISRHLPFRISPQCCWWLWTMGFPSYTTTNSSCSHAHMSCWWLCNVNNVSMSCSYPFIDGTTITSNVCVDRAESAEHGTRPQLSRLQTQAGHHALRRDVLLAIKAPVLRGGGGASSHPASAIAAASHSYLSGRLVFRLIFVISPSPSTLARCKVPRSLLASNTHPFLRTGIPLA